MYIVNGIAYAGEETPDIEVSGVRPMQDYILWVRFNTGEIKTFDFKPLLNTPVFSPLADKNVFNGVYIDYGIAVWDDGNIDISPEKLYKEGITLNEAASA